MRRRSERRTAMDISTIYRHEVFSISPIDSIAEAARTMRGEDVSSLLVFDGLECVGIITERDVTRAVAGGDAPELAVVAAYMTEDPTIIDSDTGIREAAAEMLELEVRHLPVRLAGRIVGIISLRDLLDVVVEDSTLVP
jgi:CBS domain-containing protein